MKPEERTAVYVPSLKKGLGTGHLRRGLRFVQEYGENAFLWLPPEKEAINYQTLLENPEPDIRPRIINSPGIPEADLIITDLFQTDSDLFYKLCAEAPVIGIDEGGNMRSRFAFLIDTLPSLCKSRSSITDCAFNHHGLATPGKGSGGKGILVSFGGEDPKDLGRRTAVYLAENFPDQKITVIVPADKPLSPYRSVGHSNIELMAPVENLALEMRKYTSIITSFGLTAMEAAFSSVPCLLINPSPYHQKLAEKAGFEGFLWKKPDRDKFAELILTPGKFINKKFAAGSPRRVSEFIKKAESRGYHLCPVCMNPGKTLIRTEKRRYARCPCCGLVFMFSLNEKGEEYSESYFDSEYRKQYGRTYLEDFSKIEEMGRRRLEVILKTAKGRKGSLLDIGCAYGPFLKAAKDKGYDVEGCDLSGAAVSYVKNRLKIPAWKSPGSVPDLKNRKWSVISMWYVIEHMEDLDSLLKTLNPALEPGGIFAFSTPSCSGISGKRSLRKFLINGPKDHFTVWNPNTARKILKKYGFAIKKTVISGHHPERFGFPGCGRGAGFKFFMFLSKLFKLGDTFEIYACRQKQTGGAEY